VSCKTLMQLLLVPGVICSLYACGTWRQAPHVAGAQSTSCDRQYACCSASFSNAVCVCREKAKHQLLTRAKVQHQAQAKELCKRKLPQLVTGQITTSSSDWFVYPPIDHTSTPPCLVLVEADVLHFTLLLLAYNKHDHTIPCSMPEYSKC